MNQSIIDFNKYIEILLLRSLYLKGYINKATYSKSMKEYSKEQEVA